MAQVLQIGGSMRRGFLAILIGCCALGGCQQGSTREIGAGGSWASVLPASGHVTSDDAWINIRNDARLNPRKPGPVLATSAWPEPKRPSLRRPVLIRVHPRSDSFYWYRSEERIEYRRR